MDQLPAGEEAGFHPIENKKGFGFCPKPFWLNIHLSQVNGWFFALFSFALSNCEDFFGGPGQCPKDESDGQDEK